MNYLTDDLNEALEESRKLRREQALESLKERVKIGRISEIMADPFGGQLSPQLLKVALLMAKGYQTPQIAELLKLSPNTIKVYRADVGRRLGIKPHRVPGYVLDKIEAVLDD